MNDATFATESSCTVLSVFCPGFLLVDWWRFRFSVAFLFLLPRLASFLAFASLDITRSFFAL